MNKDLDYIFPDPPEGVDPRALDPERIPESVAIIMDGNGRWAKKRALNRLKGHKAGARGHSLRVGSWGALSDHLLVFHGELEAARR